VPGVGGGDSLAGVDLCGDRVSRGVGEGGHVFIVWGSASPSTPVGMTNVLGVVRTVANPTPRPRDMGYPAYLA
jgi:hypothetical protein